MPNALANFVPSDPIAAPSAYSVETAKQSWRDQLTEYNGAFLAKQKSIATDVGVLVGKLEVLMQTTADAPEGALDPEHLAHVVAKFDELVGTINSMAAAVATAVADAKASASA